MSAVLNTHIQQELSRLNDWRRQLSDAIAAYQDWLEKTNQMTMERSLRFQELNDSIRNGRLTIAFVAEFSRGKSELINALFFATFKQRLLPSDVGRTTMCPTELFHDANDEPCIRLLPIESRYRSETIAQLRHMPVEWVKIRLNTDSASDMKGAFQTLAESKKIFALEARMMGLLDEKDAAAPAGGSQDMQTVEVPAWRYALINFPHPLLSQGISIIDTPGLNALGLEPELTLSTIPNAHAVMFLLGIDTGVTRSDLEVWQKYVPARVAQRIALLNKIDLLWDDLKSREEIEAAIARQVDATAKQLDLPRENVLPISAQKALVGKVRNEPSLVERSGIARLEAMLARQIIPARRKIIARAVMSDIGTMMAASRKAVATRMQAVEAELTETSGLSGKGKEVITKLWNQISARKNKYMEAVVVFRQQRDEFVVKRDMLLEMSNPGKLDYLLKKSEEAIADTWTTVGLNRGMNSLITMMNGEFDQIYKLSEDVKRQMQAMYDLFHLEHGFPEMRLPALDLERFKLKLALLASETEKFCKDPVNIMTEKRFLIRKFYNVLVTQARQIFGDARQDSERWLANVLLPLESQIKDHKTQLDERVVSLSKINENQEALKERVLHLKKQQLELNVQRDMIETLITRLQNQSA